MLPALETPPMTNPTPESPTATQGDDTSESVAAKLRDLDDETLCFTDQTPLFTSAAALIEAQAAEIARLTVNHQSQLIEIGDAAGEDLRHHGDALLHYSAVASVKRLLDERDGLLDSIDEAWEAFGTAGNRGALTLAEQIGSQSRELEAAEARAIKAEAALVDAEDSINLLATNGAAAAHRAEADEREACAVVCDASYPPRGEVTDENAWIDGTKHCADAIRARNTEMKS